MSQRKRQLVSQVMESQQIEERNKALENTNLTEGHIQAKD